MTSADADWPLVSLSDVTEKIMVGIANAATHAYRPSGVPLIRNQNIKPGRLDDRDLLYVDPRYEQAYKNKRLREGDLLTVRTGYPGTTCVVPAVFAGAQSFTTLISRPQPGKVDSQFLSYYINSELGQSFFTQSQIGGAQKNVNAGVLRGMPLPLPPRPEQRAIVTALDSVVSLIETLERMVVKKRDIKRGLMQQLLTGQTRLPGFYAKWREVLLGEHVSYIRTVALSRDQLDQESPLRYLHYGDIHTRSEVHLDAAAESMPRARAGLAGRAGRLLPGDLVFADASEDPAGVGKSLEVATVPPEGLVAGLHTIAARFDKRVLADGFKAYLQFIPAFRESLLRLAAGTKVLATTRSYISSVRLLVPDVEEQKAIAAVLADADAEITALERRLTSARSIKTGMMQELLTGRTRLHVEAAS